MSNKRYQRQRNRRSTKFDYDYEEYSWQQKTENESISLTNQYIDDETYCSRKHYLQPSSERRDGKRNYFNENAGTFSDSEVEPEERVSKEYWEFYKDEYFCDSFYADRNRRRCDKRSKHVSFFKFSNFVNLT